MDEGSKQQGAAAELDAETLAFIHHVFDLVRAGEASRLKPLLEHGLPPNLRNSRGDSLLMLAAYHGHCGTVAVLLEHGADPELGNDMAQTPLAAAAYKGDLAIVRLLLEHGAAIDGAAPGGRTALMTAAMFNRAAIVDYLLQQGASPALRDAAGMDAFELARRMEAADAALRLGQVLNGEDEQARDFTAPGADATDHEEDG